LSSRASHPHIQGTFVTPAVQSVLDHDFGPAAVFSHQQQQQQQQHPHGTDYQLLTAAHGHQKVLIVT